MWKCWVTNGSAKTEKNGHIPDATLMITTNWQFSWKDNALKYLQDTLNNPRVKLNENFLKNKGRYYD
jgi:hypothetical protein